MTRSIKEANRVDHIDRISDLPGNVIDGILKHLNIAELVRSSVLSTKWRYMWKSVPELEFCEDFFSRFEDLDDPDPEILRIITEVLSFHNGPIRSFSLNVPYSLDFTITTEYLSKWILFLSKRGIKVLDLLDAKSLNIKMPSDIFSCQDLTHFRCSGFNLSVPPNFCGLKKLLVLYLEHNTYEFGALQNLISGCPLLEKLSIKLSGDMKPVCFKKAKNLIDLSITIDQETVSGLIKSLPKIQTLVITSFAGKLCTDIISPTQLISLKYLKLYFVNWNDRGVVLYIASVLKSASNLVELFILDRCRHDEQEPADLPQEFECNSCCLSQLQKVKIYVATGLKFAMSLIRFILANSSSLETLSFSYSTSDAAVLLSISRDLLRMERASQRARVEFKYNY